MSDAAEILIQTVVNHADNDTENEITSTTMEGSSVVVADSHHNDERILSGLVAEAENSGCDNIVPHHQELPGTTTTTAATLVAEEDELHQIDHSPGASPTAVSGADGSIVDEVHTSTLLELHQQDNLNDIVTTADDVADEDVSSEDHDASSSASNAHDDDDLLEGILNEGDDNIKGGSEEDKEAREKHKRDKQERKRQKKEKKEKKRLRKLEKEAKKAGKSSTTLSGGGKVSGDVVAPKAPRAPAPKKGPTEAAIERQRKKEEQEHEQRKLAAFHNSQAVLAQSAPSMNLSAALSNAFSNPTPPPPPLPPASGNHSQSQSSTTASVTVPVANEEGSSRSAGVPTNPPTPSNLSPTTQHASAPIPAATTLTTKSSSRRPVLSAPPSSVCAMTKSFLAKVKSQQDAKITQRLNIGRCVSGTTGVGGTNSNVAKTSRSGGATTTTATKKSSKNGTTTTTTTAASSSASSPNYLTEMSPLLDGGSNAAVTFPVQFSTNDNDDGDDGTDDDSSVSSAGTDVCIVDADEDDNRLTNNLSISNFGSSKNGNTAALFARRNGLDNIGIASQPKTPTASSPAEGASSVTTDLLRRISSFSSSSAITTAKTSTLTTSTTTIKSSSSTLFSATAASAAKQASKTATNVVTGMKRSRSTLSAIAAGIPVASNRRFGDADSDDEDEGEEEVSELEKEHARSVIRRQEIRRLQTHHQKTQQGNNNSSLVGGGSIVQQQQQHGDVSNSTLAGESQSLALTTASAANTVNGGGNGGFVAAGARLLARRRSAFVSEITGKEDVDSSSNVAGGGGNSNSVARMLKRTNSVENSLVTHKTVVFGASGTSDQ